MVMPSESELEPLEPLEPLQPLDALEQLDPLDALDGWQLARFAAVGFLVNCQPSEPYLTKFLLEGKGLSASQVSDVVWPSDVLASLVWLVPCGVAAERAGYWRVVLAGLLFRQATRLLLLFGQGLGGMVAMQVAYAGATSCNTVYFASTLALFPSAAGVATSTVFAAYHAGNLLGSLIGEVSFSVLDWANLYDLFCMSWAFSSLGLVWFLVNVPSIPSPRRAKDFRAGAVLALYSQLDHPARVWCAAAVCGQAAAIIFFNYYQLLFYAESADAHFGFLEMALEASSLLGSALPALMAVRGAGLGVGLAPASLALVAILDAVSAGGASGAGLVATTLLRSGAFALQQVLAQAAVHRGAQHGRFAYLLTCNAALALLLAALVQQAGALAHWGAPGFVAAASAVNAAAAAATAALLLLS